MRHRLRACTYALLTRMSRRPPVSSETFSLHSWILLAEVISRGKTLMPGLSRSLIMSVFRTVAITWQPVRVNQYSIDISPIILLTLTMKLIN